MLAGSGTWASRSSSAADEHGDDQDRPAAAGSRRRRTTTCPAPPRRSAARPRSGRRRPGRPARPVTTAAAQPPRQRATAGLGYGVRARLRLGAAAAGSTSTAVACGAASAAAPVGHDRSGSVGCGRPARDRSRSPAGSGARERARSALRRGARRELGAARSGRLVRARAHAMRGSVPDQRPPEPRPERQRRARTRDADPGPGDVGLTGFEPAASSSRTKRATKLRHSPIGPPEQAGGNHTRAPPAPPKSDQVVGRHQGQQRRLGAAGDPDPGVRAGAEPGRDVQPRRARVAGPRGGRVAVQALGAGRLEVAVGGQRADARQADLAAVGVAGEHRVVPVGGELVEHPQVRRVRDAEPQVGVGSAGPGDRRRAGRSRGAGRRRRRTRSAARAPRASRAGWSGRAQPASVKPSRRSRHGSCGRVGVPLAVVGQQVAQRVAQGRREVVVGAEDEDARARRAAPPRQSQHDRHRVAVGEVVAGVDDQVGPQVGEAAQPRPACGSGRASCACR